MLSTALELSCTLLPDRHSTAAAAMLGDDDDVDVNDGGN